MRGIDGNAYIVTGAGSGIGKATTVSLIRSGARVVAGDINGGALAALTEHVANEAKLTTVQFDLADEASIISLVARAKRDHRRIDGVVNAAADLSEATMSRDCDLADMDASLWSSVLQVNLIGTGIVIREVVPHLREANGGSIVNISSAAAWLGEAARPAYAASKIGLHAMTRHVARAWGRQNIRCNCIAPGMVLSQTGSALMPRQYQDDMLAAICLPDLGQPDDIAAGILFLLSDEARWITGQVIPIDGGLFYK